MTIGTALGVAAAARRGLFEAVVMRICDAMFAFPPILSAIMVGALLGPGALTAMLAIGAFMVPVFARVTRGAALQIWAREYVLAARMAGRAGLSITAVHVIPNIASHIIIQSAIQLALAILTEAGLELPRPRRAAADAELGPDACGRADLSAACALAGAGAGPCDRLRRARPQPARRRPARPARSRGEG